MVSYSPLITDALTVYALTFVMASSAIFEPFRTWFMNKTPWLKIGNHKHFIECRMCVGWWASLVVCGSDYMLILPVYGLAYFLATQER